MQKKLTASLQDILIPIESYLKKVDEVIPEILKTGISLMDDSSLHLFKNSGKKVRASIVIFSSGLKGEIPDEIIEIAAAVETFHSATLIHDDIIDQAIMRRGGKSVSTEWGNKVAVLVGDYMYIKALQGVMGGGKSIYVPELLAAALDMIKGEIYQMEFSGIDVINKEHYFNIIELKTAGFMGTCAKLGGMKAQMADEEKNALYQFGVNIGRAFQIVDDTFDYVEEDSKTGKDAGNDFRNGKITLPYIHLLDAAKNGDKELLVECAKKPTKDGWDIVKQKIDEYNAVGFCMNVAEEYLYKAIPFLDAFPSTLYKNKLLELANFFVNRDY